MTAAIIAGVFGFVCALAACSYRIGLGTGLDRGEDKSSELIGFREEAAVQEYIASQIWEYEDKETPMRRVNKISGEIQKRYLTNAREYSFGRTAYTDWRTVTDLKEGKK